MISRIALNVTIESFQTCIAGKKVVLLYPWTTYRNLFLAHFTETAQSQLLYFRVPDTQSDLGSWLTLLAEWLELMQSGLSTRLKQALVGDSPARMGEALAADLKGSPKILFIDELDRVPLDDDFNRFIESAIRVLPDDVQIVLSSRHLTRQPWYDMLVRGEGCVLGTEYLKDDGMFTIEDTERPHLEVYAFGQGHVFVDGREITQWEGALPRNLFFYLVDHPLITRDEIFEIFWPNLSVKEATNVFHVTKRKITGLISAAVGAGTYELTQYKSGFYTPSNKVARHYDAADFEDVITRATTAVTDQEEQDLLLRAIALYREAYLQTIDMPWAVERREKLRQQYVQACNQVARSLRRTNDWQRALGFYSRAIKVAPEREDIHREMMKIYIQNAMYADAIKQYESLATTLKDMLGVTPAPELRELYGSITSTL